MGAKMQKKNFGVSDKSYKYKKRLTPRGISPTNENRTIYTFLKDAEVKTTTSLFIKFL